MRGLCGTSVALTVTDLRARTSQHPSRGGRLRMRSRFKRGWGAVALASVVLLGTVVDCSPVGAHEVVGASGVTSTAHQWGLTWGYPNAGPPPGSRFLGASCTGSVSSCTQYPEITGAEHAFYGAQEWKWVAEQTAYR